MGPGIVILFWLVVAALFGGLWVASLAIFIVARKKNWRIAKWVSGVSFTGTSLLGILCLSLLSYGLIRAITPHFVFEEALGRKPPQNVTDIKSKVWWFADEGSTWLTFDADRVTFEALIPRNLQKMTLTEYQKVMGHYSGKKPNWWHPLDDPDVEIYFFSPPWGQGSRFASEETLMTFSPATQRVHYQFIGID